MTPKEFRKMALGFPEAAEQSHMNHPDFRVRGKIFATLGPGEKWGMVKLKPEQQATFVRAEPDVFEPAAGAWGRQGSTLVHLREAKKKSVRQAMILAWRNTAPTELTDAYDEE